MVGRKSCSWTHPPPAIALSNWRNCPPATNQTGESDMSGFVHPEYLVETGWLAEHLSDVVLLDCTVHLIPDPKATYVVKPAREDFERGHIQGAQFCDVQKDVSDSRGKFNFMRQTPEDFASAMRRFGVGNATKVV